MPSRRGWLALALSALCLAAAAIPFSFSAAASSTNENAHTLDLALPGPFNGCSFFDQNATPTSDAILDLIRPSAFVTASNGVLVGEDGPIASAELTSLSPETVRYTIAPKMVWSNGAAFTGDDLVSWWVKARSLASVSSDGYRAIKSLVVSKNDLTVTAVFRTPYADWDLLFRDMDAPGVTTGCGMGNLLNRPSLGALHRDERDARANRAQHESFVAARSQSIRSRRHHRLPRSSERSARSTSRTTRRRSTASTVLTLSNRPTLASKIASSNNIEELTYSPQSATTSLLAVREALSWSVQRQPLIDTLFGAVTYSPSIAASAIFSQGQADYPGAAGSNPVGTDTTTTTTPSNSLSDCADLRGDGPKVERLCAHVNGLGRQHGQEAPRAPRGRSECARPRGGGTREG